MFSRSRLFTAAFVLSALLVVWFSLAPMTAEPVARHIDKLEHFAAYSGLTLLGIAALGRATLGLVAAILVFGAGVEVLQALLPTGRTGSMLDALANAAGAGCAWAGWAALMRLRRGR